MHADNVLASYASNGNLNARYVTPGLDDNLAMTRGENTYYYMADGLGSIRNVLDSSEVAQNTYDYYAFGDSLGTQTQGVTNPYRYTGREYESGSVLDTYYYRNRYYMSGLGIFTSRDAIWADMDRGWTYVANRPTTLRDPYGLEGPIDDGMAGLGILGETIGYDKVAQRLDYKYGKNPETERGAVAVMQLVQGDYAPETNLEGTSLQIMSALFNPLDFLGDVRDLIHAFTNCGVTAGDKALSVAALLPVIGAIKPASKAFKSLRAMKKAMGAAGEGKVWHHLVEQRNAAKFGAEAVHNSENVVPLARGVNQKIADYYSRKYDWTNGKTIREWLDSKSFEEQYQFGLDAMKRAEKGEL